MTGLSLRTLWIIVYLWRLTTGSVYSKAAHHLQHRSRWQCIFLLFIRYASAMPPSLFRRLLRPRLNTVSQRRGWVDGALDPWHLFSSMALNPPLLDSGISSTIGTIDTPHTPKVHMEGSNTLPATRYDPKLSFAASLLKGKVLWGFRVPVQMHVPNNPQERRVQSGLYQNGSVSLKSYRCAVL